MTAPAAPRRLPFAERQLAHDRGIPVDDVTVVYYPSLGTIEAVVRAHIPVVVCSVTVEAPPGVEAAS